MGNVMEKVERYKLKANLFLKQKTQAFIENIQGDYFFCRVIEVKDDYLIVKGFAGKRKFEVDKIFFLDIIRLEEYEEKEVKKSGFRGRS